MMSNSRINLDDNTAMIHDHFEGIIRLIVIKSVFPDSDDEQTIMRNYHTFMEIQEEDLDKYNPVTLSQMIFKEFAKLKKDRKGSKYEITRFPSFDEILKFSTSIYDEVKK